MGEHGCSRPPLHRFRGESSQLFRSIARTSELDSLRHEHVASVGLVDLLSDPSGIEHQLLGLVGVTFEKGKS